MKKTINNFFENIKEIQQNNTKTNIMYLTTRCNMDCRYCFEKKRRDEPSFQHNDMSKHEIDDFLNEILEREYDAPNHTIVIMGGEPTVH